MKLRSIRAWLAVWLVLACDGRSRLRRPEPSSPNNVGGETGQNDGPIASSGAFSESGMNDQAGGSVGEGGVTGAFASAGRASSSPEGGDSAQVQAGESGNESSDEEFELYFQLWEEAQAERGPDEPAPPEGADRGCFDCVNSKAAGTCVYPADNGCAPYTACVERHCLNFDPPPVTFVDCLETCLPVNDWACHDEWLSFATCIGAECTSACQEH